MDTLKRLRNSFPLLLLIITSLALAEEPLPDPKEWVPDKVSVTIPADRQNPYALLEWKRTPVFKSTKEKIVLGIEAELVFPELKRVGAERYWPTNRLKKARSRILSESCYYQDNYFLDRCENWTLGIDTSTDCLLSVLPGKVGIDYIGTVPPTATTARYQIQTVGVDTVSGKGFTPIGRIVGPTQESQLVGEFCSAFCEYCFSSTAIWVDRTVCLSLAKLKNPYATWEWLEAFCPSCEAAKNQSPEWRNFLIDQAQCVEPVHVPGTTTSYSCVCSPYADGCDPVDLSTPQHICLPGEKRCSGANRETCSADGLRWGNGFTCGCGCNGNDCGAVNTCSAGTNDMSSGGGSLPDMSVALPPPDLAIIPPGVEVCDGKDNNSNGQVDELPSCWLTVYRFRDPVSNARCYGPTNIAPPVCTGYVFEKELFTVPSSPWLDGTTNERVQCSSGANHIITIKNGGEHATLQASGWSCNVSLGYWFQTGTGKTVGTPYSFTCPVYRTWFTTSSGVAHIFSSHTESFAGTFTCEPPTRGDVVQNIPCGRPSGC